MSVPRCIHAPFELTWTPLAVLDSTFAWLFTSFQPFSHSHTVRHETLFPLVLSSVVVW